MMAVKKFSFVLVAVALSCMLAACSSGSAASGPGSTSRALVKLLGSVLSTTAGAYIKRGTLIYLLAGKTNQSAGIYAWHFREGAPALATPPSVAFSYFTGAGQRLVASEANASKLMDMVYRGSVVTIKDKGVAIRGVTPTLSSAGELTYVVLSYVTRQQALPSAFEIVGRKPALSGKPHVIYTQPYSASAGQYLVGPTWSSNSKLLAFTSASITGGKTQILITNGIKLLRRIPIPVKRGSAVSWAPHSPWLSIFSGNNSFLVDSRNGQVISLEPGWRSMCWNPEGTGVLAVKAGEVALINQSSPKSAYSLGRFPAGSVMQCYWPPADH